MTKRSGFTLVELLVAIAIFAVLSALGWKVFDYLIKIKERNTQHEQRLGQLQEAYQQVLRDTVQIKQRLRLIIRMTERYLESIESQMTVRDYLASIWSLTHGAAAILNSSFYQRYLGSRDTLRVAYIDQALAMPKQTGAAGYLA